MSSVSVFEGGFQQPVFQSQAVFRALMDAQARPGSVHDIGGYAHPPAPLTAASGAVALALCDADTPVWLDKPCAQSGEVGRWLAFHCGAPVTGDAASAAFAFTTVSAMPALGAFAQGSQEYPDRSTTVIVQISDLMSGPALSLSGPGILGATTITPAGLPAGFVRQWQDNRALFPRGVDVILASATAIMALPRSVRIEAMEA